MIASLNLSVEDGAHFLGEGFNDQCVLPACV